MTLKSYLQPGDVYTYQRQCFKRKFIKIVGSFIKTLYIALDTTDDINDKILSVTVSFLS